MKRFGILAACAVLATVATPAFATDTTTFAQFFQSNPSAKLFRYENLDVGATKSAHIYSTSTANSTVYGGIAIGFAFGVDNLPLDLDGLQDAHLWVNFLSTTGTTGTGTNRIQTFGNGTISMLRDTPADEGTAPRTNLLSVSFTNAELDASQNGGSFTFKSTAGSTIGYTSDFLDFTGLVAEDFSFSFSGASPTFSATLGSSGRNTRVSGTGTFASNPVPVITGSPPTPVEGVPEASTWAMLLVGFGAIGAMMRAGRKPKDLFAA